LLRGQTRSVFRTHMLNIRAERQPGGLSHPARIRHQLSHGAATTAATRTAQHRTQHRYRSHANVSRLAATRSRPRPQQPSREVQRGSVSRPAPAEPVPPPASTSLRRCRRRRRSRPLRGSPRDRPRCHPHPWQPSREVQRGGLSRPARAEPVPPPASTSRG